ncbi:MAG: sigma 54-interacting transcriptional regulator, partial [Bdellovibrionota bacterium]
MKRILVVEDDALVRESLRKALAPHEVLSVESLALFPASLKIEDDALDLVLLDLKSDHDVDATKTLARLPDFRRRFPSAEIWVQSGSDDLALMRACIRAGAQRFLLKSHLMAELPIVLESLEARSERRARIAKTIRGKSAATVRLREELLWLGESGADILIEGESGAGKELCAAALSDEIVAVNVAALPSELFEAELFGFEKGA